MEEQNNECWTELLGRPKAGLRLSTATTKLANSPITDAPDDIVVSLSGSFQLDFVVHDGPDGFRRFCIRFKKWIWYDGSWQSERTHDAQLIVWAVLADGIGHRKLFAAFYRVCHAARSV